MEEEQRRKEIFDDILFQSKRMEYYQRHMVEFLIKYGKIDDFLDYLIYLERTNRK